MARTYKQILKQIEEAKKYEADKDISLFELEEIKAQSGRCSFSMILTAYNLGFLRCEESKAKRKPR